MRIMFRGQHVMEFAVYLVLTVLEETGSIDRSLGPKRRTCKPVAVGVGVVVGVAVAVVVVAVAVVGVGVRVGVGVVAAAIQW